MKTRAEIYGNEAATLLVTMYPGLNMQQLLCFHPGKSETAKALLSHLERQGRIFQSDNGGYFPAGYSPKADQALIKAVWVLLDHRSVRYHLHETRVGSRSRSDGKADPAVRWHQQRDGFSL